MAVRTHGKPKSNRASVAGSGHKNTHLPHLLHSPGPVMGVKSTRGRLALRLQDPRKEATEKLLVCRDWPPKKRTLTVARLAPAGDLGLR